MATSPMPTTTSTCAPHGDATEPTDARGEREGITRIAFDARETPSDVARACGTRAGQGAGRPIIAVIGDEKGTVIS
jgi:hypothetical protein